MEQTHHALIESHQQSLVELELANISSCLPSSLLLVVVVGGGGVGGGGVGDDQDEDHIDCFF